MVMVRNDKFYNLFSALGASYVITYLSVIIFNIRSALFITLCFFALWFVGFLILYKIKKEIHYGVVKGIYTGWDATILVDIFLPVDLIEDASTTSLSRYGFVVPIVL